MYTAGSSPPWGWQILRNQSLEWEEYLTRGKCSGLVDKHEGPEPPAWHLRTEGRPESLSLGRGRCRAAQRVVRTCSQTDWSVGALETPLQDLDLHLKDDGKQLTKCRRLQGEKGSILREVCRNSCGCCTEHGREASSLEAAGSGRVMQAWAGGCVRAVLPPDLQVKEIPVLHVLLCGYKKVCHQHQVHVVVFIWAVKASIETKKRPVYP